MESGNPFSPPQANLEVAAEAPSGSLQAGIDGRYDFSIDEVLSASWGKVKGFKGAFWSTAIVAFLFMIPIFVGQMIVGQIAQKELGQGLGMVVNQLFSFLTGPIMTAIALPIYVIGLLRVDGKPVSFRTFLSHGELIVPTVLTAFLATVMMLLGTILLILPGIYLTFAYVLYIPLVIEHRLSPWQALEASRKALTKHWFKVFGLILLIGLISLLTIFTLGIALIWVLPWSVLAIAELQRRVFGPAPTGNVSLG